MCNHGPCVLVFVCCLTLSVSADEWERIRHGIRTVKTIDARFRQEKNLKILKKPLVSTGRFVYRSPDSVRWEYLEPMKSVSLVHKGNARRYMWSREEGFIQDASSNIEAMQIVMGKLSDWMSGRFTRDETFSATLKPGPPVTVVLTPQDDAIADFIQRVELAFSADCRVVEEVRITESERASTVIRFEEVKLNTQLPDNLFEAFD